MSRDPTPTKHLYICVAIFNSIIDRMSEYRNSNFFEIEIIFQSDAINQFSLFPDMILYRQLIFEVVIETRSNIYHCQMIQTFNIELHNTIKWSGIRWVALFQSLRRCIKLISAVIALCVWGAGGGGRGQKPKLLRMS